jgi:hypothetical protein
VVIDWALKGGKITPHELKQRLQKERIEMVVQRGQQGRTYGVVFLDYQSKTAFIGSDLGKQYSAKGLEERCLVPIESQTISQHQQPHQTIGRKQSEESASLPGPLHSASPLPDFGYSSRESLWEILLKPIPQRDDLPYELTHDMKQKKKLRHRQRPS